MNWFSRSLLSTALSSLLVTMPLHATGQGPDATGVVVEADRAHIGNGPVSAGATVYVGDVISTEQDGHAQVRVGQTRFQLQGDTEAAFFTGPNGAVAELR